MAIEMSDKTKMTTFLICFFFGALGFHRFYTGKTLSGVLYFFTIGFLGIGVLIDLVMILLGKFTDSQGKLLTG